MKNILTLNSISPVINNVFDASYKIENDIKNPIGILLRSFKMHDYDIPESVIHKIAEKKPMRVVFRDSSFNRDANKINVEEIFKLKTPDTTVKVI